MTFSRIVSCEQKRVLFEELEWGGAGGAGAAEWNRGSREWLLLIKGRGSPRLCVPSATRPCLATGPGRDAQGWRRSWDPVWAELALEAQTPVGFLEEGVWSRGGEERSASR